MSQEIIDKMWIWGHRVNQFYNSWGINAESKATPSDGARYLGVSNIMMCLPPSEEEARGVSHLKHIVWCVYYDESWQFLPSLQPIRDLATRYPQIEGVLVDDLSSWCIRKGMKPELLAQLHAAVRGGTRPLALWGVFYNMNLDLNLEDYFPYIDVSTFWTWRAEDLKDLEGNFEAFEKRIGDKPIILGLYMYDYGDKRQMPVPLMKKQCRIALELLKEKRIQGMHFITSSITDLGFEAVEWTRDWIKAVGRGQESTL